MPKQAYQMVFMDGSFALVDAELLAGVGETDQGSVTCPDLEYVPLPWASVDELRCTSAVGCEFGCRCK